MQHIRTDGMGEEVVLNSLHVPQISHQWIFFFFFYGDITNKVYAAKPATLYELKEEITRQCLAIPNEMFRNVVESICHRYKLCLENGGNQFEHLRTRRNE